MRVPLQETQTIFKHANLILYKCQKHQKWSCILLQDGLPSNLVCRLNKDPPPPLKIKKKTVSGAAETFGQPLWSRAANYQCRKEQNRTEKKKAGRDVCLQPLTGLSVEDTHRISKKLNVQDELRIRNALRKVSDAVVVVYCVALKSSEFCTKAW